MIILPEGGLILKGFHRANGLAGCGAVGAGIEINRFSRLQGFFQEQGPQPDPRTEGLGHEQVAAPQAAQTGQDGRVF